VRLPLARIGVMLLTLAAASARADVTPLERLSGFLDRVQTLSAEFRQVQGPRGEAGGEESRGSLLIKRPGRFRWDYREPYERVVVADGRELWLYEADLAQVTVRSLDAGLGETPAALLTGGREILDRFETVDSWRAEKLDWVRLRPRSTDSDFDSVAIGFDGERIAQLDIDDRLGQQTRIFFSAVSINPRLDDARFVFEVPTGADVIREGDL
jgi:outer membrane lipoprotein carrier protein